MELYIIRHGQSTNNAIGEDAKRRVRDPELTEVGHKQADLAAEFLSTATDLEQIVRHPADSSARVEPHKHGITHLYCSAMHRALQTARPIGAALGLKTEVWVDIHEHGGIFEEEEEGLYVGYGGLTRSQIVALFPDYALPETVTEAGWWKPEAGHEDIVLCHARAMRVKEQLLQRAMNEATADDHVAIISHGTFIDSLLKSFLRTLPGEHYFHWHYNTGMTRLDIWPSGRVIVRYINRVTHLPPELVT